MINEIIKEIIKEIIIKIKQKIIIENNNRNDIKDIKRNDKSLKFEV